MEDYKIIVQAFAGRRGPQAFFYVNAIKKGAYERRITDILEPRRVGDALFHQELGDLVLLCLLRMLLRQPTKLVMTGQELVSRSEHPADLPARFVELKPTTRPRPVQSEI